MRKTFILLLSLLVFASCSKNKEDDRVMVLLDTDMVEVFDDGVVLLMLASNPDVNLLGITTVTGNTWNTSGTAYAIRQLEAIGRTDIPVVEGANRPLLAEQFNNLRADWTEWGYGDQYLGALETKEYDTWLDAYHAYYNSEPTMKPQEIDAADFIIKQVRANPGKVCLLAIGPCTNIANAVQRDPGIVPLVKKIVYMGGNFHCEGHELPWAEFNWLADPDAANIAVHAPFAEQLVVGQDVSDRVRMTGKYYHELIDATTNDTIKEMFKKNYLNGYFEKDPDLQWYMWDIISALALLDESYITNEENTYVTVTTEGKFRGQCNLYDESPEEGTQKIRIILDADDYRIRDAVLETVSKL